MDQTVSPQAYDVERIRQDFPILSRTVYGKPLVYLDNGASAQKPQVVIDAISHAYANEYANVHRGLHFLSNAATDAYELSREKVRRFLNAASVDEIVFTKSSTEAINTVAYGWGMPKLGADDEILISIMEHHSNIVPWHFIRERQGAKLVWAPVDDQGAFHIDDFVKCLTPKTKLVAITHMSNALGTIVDVKEICRIAHERGIPVLVDGSQAAVHMPVDVQDIDCDWYVMTGHKLYGPSGIGVLYGKKDRLAEMRPFMGGGEMIIDVSEDAISYNEPPHRFEAGTPPIVQAIGLGVALDYMDGVGRDRIAQHEAGLAAYAAERLQSVNALRVIGQAPGKGGIFSFEIEGVHAHDISTVIDRSGVAVRAGTHCAMPLLKRFGVTSTCRASFGLYNTRAEVDVLVAALEKARTFFA
ncbi:cysteine desulfurase [Rhizobium sp. Leaf384]|uniref:cysteine desulfurase n=1 Tax=unclassified Rhizobium TaxID=2613769 RepID=UPI0007159533|nr:MULTISPECIES: cysteine desulfurase [unclassified Rhizobium]KQS79127.1 cysteine desulfurase [Rhizobium sp. Leaf384]KQS82695.1 cysteine desulfurase [Rhizobium sp. Leaf383]